MNEPIAKLIGRLHEKTERKEIRWKRNANKNFEASFPNYTVELADAEDTIWLYIYNNEGDILDSTTSHQLGDWSMVESSDELEDLYRMARRIALGSDEAIEKLLAALED
jgi:hypothetical protein